MEGSLGLRKGAWAKVEDDLLRACIQQYGEGKWHLVPSRAGLNRCRKSCRLRWLNYLKPNIKRGEFAEDEVDLMIRMHRLLGNRWSLIAGRLPGRTPNDVKNYWNTYVRRNNKHNNSNNNPSTLSSTTPTPPRNPRKDNDVHHPQVIKPHPRTFSKASASAWLLKKTSDNNDNNNNNKTKEEGLLEVHDDEVQVDEDRTKADNNNGCGGCDEDAGGDTCRKGGCQEKLLNGGWFSSGGDEEEEDWKLLFSDLNNWDDDVNNVHVDHGDDAHDHHHHHFFADDADADHDMLINNLEGQTWSDILLDINLWDQQ